jgi:hypothetical protein
MATGIQVVFDCADPGAQAAFWAEALHYSIEAPPEGDVGHARNDWAAADDPEGVGPRLYFQRVPEGKTAKNRVHLDLGVGSAPGLSLEERKIRILAEVDRLKALGASDRRGAIEQDGEYWVRMNDPEGSEFCVQ